MAFKHKFLMFAMLFSVSTLLAVDDLGTFVDLVDKPRVEGDAFQLDGDFTFSNNQFNLIISAGTTVQPLKAPEGTLGFFIQGSATAQYHSKERPEYEVMAYNVRRNTSLTGSSGGLSFPVQAAILWLGSVPQPGWTTSPAAPVPQEALDKHLEDYLNNQTRSIGLDLAAGVFNAPTFPSVYVDMRGKKGDFLYSFDPYRDLEMLELYTETYNNAPDKDLRRFKSLRTISKQRPLSSIQQPKSPAFYLTDLKFELTGEGSFAVLKAQETLMVGAANLKVLVFNLDEKEIYRTGMGDFRAAPWQVQSVSLADGTALSFKHSRDLLLVQMPSAPEAGKPLLLNFHVKGDKLFNQNGKEYWSLGTSPWYPTAEFGGNYFTVHSKIKVKKPYLPFSPGTTVARGEEGEYNFLEKKIDKPIFLMVVNAGKYHSIDYEYDGGQKIRLVSYGMAKPKMMKQLADLAFGIIKYYEGFLGPFPFNEFVILESDGFGYGQAPPGFMYISEEAFTSKKAFLGAEVNDLLAGLFSEGVNERYAHEIAHQYWGHVIKWPSEQEQWLSESFAEYSAALFLRDAQKESVYKRMVKTWKTKAKTLAQDVTTIPCANNIYDHEFRRARQARQAALYNKGPMLLAHIHEQIGEEAFLTFLSSYQKNFAWRFGTTDHVAGLLTAITKQDWKPYFKQYYWGNDLPQ